MAEEYTLPEPLGPVEEVYTLPEPIGPAEEPESDQTVIGSIARGAGAGLVNIAQGISELGASGLEVSGLIEDGNQQATTQFFEDTKQALGFTPERAAGKITELIVNYGAPGVGVFSWVSKADKARRALKAGTKIPDATSWFGKSAQAFGRSGPGALTATRAGRAALTTAGTGIADILVSPSTNITLADSWDAMPEGLQTESEEGLIGKELAAVRMRNKLRLGIEGAAFNAAGEIVLPVAGAVIKGIGNVPGMPTLARGLSAGLDAMGNKLLEVKVGGVPVIKKYLTPNGLAPAEVATSIRTAEAMAEGQEKIAADLLANYDKAIKKVTGSQKLLGKNKRAIQRASNDTMDYMTGDLSPADFTKAYGKEATEAVDSMRDQVTNLSNQFEQSIRSAPNLSPSQQSELLQQFQNNQGTYLRRLYELHLRPKTFANTNVRELPQYRQARTQVAQVLQKRNNQLTAEQADNTAELMIDEIFDESLMQQGLSPEAIAKQMSAAVANGAKDTVGRTSLFTLADGMLKDRSQILDNAPMLREMMGEIRDPREAFLRTVDNISNTMASQRLFDDVASTGIKPFNQAMAEMNTGARPFVIDGNTVTDQAARELEKMGYVRAGEFNPDNPFGGKFGSLSGNFVPGEIYNALTTPGRTQSWVQDALAVSLQMKGMSQMAKTVLNPLSQIRNFLSNTFVVGANGLLGRNMGVFESAQVLTANALDSPEQFKLLRALADEGVIGQNIQLNELRRLMQEQTELGVSSMLQKGGAAFRRSKLGAPVRFMEKTYQLGDDYWKVVGALGEKARYGAALRKAGLDIDNLDEGIQGALMRSGLVERTGSIANTDFGNLLAADIVKATMPTYSMVPEAIKMLRRVPVMGNFMSFPAEIIRTSGNIVNRSLKEMGFQVTDDLVNSIARSKGIGVDAARQQANALARQIRGIGAQRLSGYTSMATVAPIAIKGAAHDTLGITEDQEKLLEQNAPFWTKGNTLMYLETPDKDGNAEYVDLSYMMPYEFMLTPARAAMAEYQAKGSVGASEAEQILAAAWQGFKKFSEPFASEALATERVLDVTTRQGRTQTGAEVYDRDGDMWGDQLSKSLAHVVGAFIPGIIDQVVTVRGGEFVPGRATRAATGMPSKQGDPYSVAEEAGTMLTGLRPMKLDLGRSLSYAGTEYAVSRTAASQIFTSKADDNDVTAEDVMNAYVKANDSRRRQQAELRSRIQAAQDAGMSRAAIVRAMKDSGVSSRELSAIMANRFVPIKVSRELIREVNKEVNVKQENRILQRLPVREINQLRLSLANTPITSEEPDYVLPEPLGPVEQAPQIQAPETRTLVPEPQPSESFVDRAVDSAQRLSEGLVDRARTIAPSVLGDSLSDQAANAEIARRQQGQ
ncbi:MAG: hypothetical protein K0U55_12770 [Gammaproteobacteria bacterium]|nr:hypothetical protein [Gammaproteobacteria bacterium]